MSENNKERNGKGGGHIRRADVSMMAFFLLLALGSFVWLAANRKEGQVLRISCDGRTVAEAPLPRDWPQAAAAKGRGAARYCLILYGTEGVSCEWYETRPDPALAVPGDVSYNLLAVSGSGVSMEAADCRDQICVRHIPVTDSGESIICLPHKLVVEILGGG